MMDSLKRFFNAAEKEPEMAQVETQAPTLAVDRTAELELAQASLADVQNKLADLSAKYEASQAALAAIEAEKAQMVADKQAAQTNTRLNKLSVVIGDAKAAELNTKLATADEDTFNTVLSSLAMSYEKEAASFKEVGVSAEAAPAPTANDTVTKLAAALAEQFKIN